MKKLFLVALFAIGSAVGFSQTKFAHLDYVKVQDTLTSYKDAMKELRSLADEAERELGELEEKYLSIEKELVTYPADGSALGRERIEKRMRKAQEIYMMTQESYQKDMRVLQDMLLTPIQKTIDEAIKIVSERQKLNYVFEKQNMLYASGLDITNEVMIEAIRLDNERIAKLKSEQSSN